jgi:hypothetical protein
VRQRKPWHRKDGVFMYFEGTIKFLCWLRPFWFWYFSHLWFCSYWWLNTKSCVALVLSIWIRTIFESILSFSVHTVIMVVARFVWVKCYQILRWQKKSPRFWPIKRSFIHILFG